MFDFLKEPIKRWILLTLILSACVSGFIAGCDPAGKKGPKKKELLIYCGTAMLKPMSEIAEIIEKEENCKILITAGGSGNLYRSIGKNNIGDMFLPGSDFYIETCLKEGLVAETVHVGYNRAAMMVQKGNPKGITADLNNFVNKDYYVVIGNPKSGAIGDITKELLERKGIYEEVIENARRLTIDSKDLFQALKSGEADLVINWFAVSTWPETRPYVDVLAIDEKFAVKKKLVLGLLKTSRQPDIARKFMAYAAGEKGRSLFNKYGLYDMEQLQRHGDR